MSVEVGSQYRFTFTVTDNSGNPIDPATSSVTVHLPDGSTATPAIQHDSTGNFHADYTGVQEGLHSIVAQTTGPVGSKTDYVNFNVFRSIVGIDTAKSYVSFDSTGGRESILRDILAATTELIEDEIGTCVVRTFTNEKIVGKSAMVLKLPHSPLPNDTAVTSISSVWTGGPVWTQANGNFVVFPNSGTVQLSTVSTPFYLGPWKATYQAGRTVIPPKVQLAAMEIIYDLWSSQRQFGMDSFEPGPEETARWEQMLATYRIPPHAMAMLAAEQRPGFR